MPESTALTYGRTHTYLVGSLLVDTDLPGTLNAFHKKLRAHGLIIGDIRYVLATHTSHSDTF